MNPKKKSSTPVLTIRQMALDHINDIAKEIRKSDPTLTREQAVTKAALETPEGRQAYALTQEHGSELPWPEYIAGKAAGQVYVRDVGTLTHGDRVAALKRDPSLKSKATSDHLNRHRLREAALTATGYYDDAPGGSVGKSDAKTDYLNARHAQLKEGSGSGPRGGRVEDPVTSGTRRPADNLPNLSDSIYAQIKLAAVAAFPAMSPEQAVTTYLTTQAGNEIHARFAAARQQEAR